MFKDTPGGPKSAADDDETINFSEEFGNTIWSLTAGIKSPFATGGVQSPAPAPVAAGMEENDGVVGMESGGEFYGGMEEFLMDWTQVQVPLGGEGV